jgi:hypothetical protein
MTEVLSASRVTLIPRSQKVWQNGSKMSVLQLIILVGALLMFFMGYKIGHRDGYIVGRKAVRKQYELRDKVRA